MASTELPQRKRNLWIIWTFIPGLSWVAFFYIGIRTRSGRWVVWGIGYFVLLIIFGSWTNSPALIVLLFYLVPIIHAFIVRRAYQAKLALRQQNNTGTSMEFTEPSLNKDQGVRSTANQQSTVESPLQSRNPATVASSQQSSGIDLNKSSEQELANLPGIGIIVAKKAVSVRESRRGFSSVEDFGAALNLKPHIVERIRPLVSVSPVSQSEQSGPSGRVVDY